MAGCGLLAGRKQTSGRLHLPSIQAPLCIRCATAGQNLNQKMSNCSDDGNSKRPFADSTVVIVSGRNHQQTWKSMGRMVVDNKRCASCSCISPRDQARVVCATITRVGQMISGASRYQMPRRTQHVCRAVPAENGLFGKIRRVGVSWGLGPAPSQSGMLNVVCAPGAAPSPEHARQAESEALPPTWNRTCTLVGPPARCPTCPVQAADGSPRSSTAPPSSERSVSASQGVLKEARTWWPDPGRQEGASGDVDAGDPGVGWFPGPWCRRGRVLARQGRDGPSSPVPT